AIIEQSPRWEQELRKSVKDLVRETLMAAVGHLLDDLMKKYEGFPALIAHPSALGKAVLDNSGDFIKPDESASILALADDGSGPFRRYQVNLFVDNAETRGAPIVYEDHPVYDRLIGRVEHLSRLGALLTDVG